MRRHSLLSLRSLLALAFGFALFGCGNEATVGSSGGDGGVAPEGGGGTIATGTCRFTLKNGAETRTFDGKARARMNGSGNLLVQCDASDGGAASTRFGFGNATFDGPRTYKADDFTSDGSMYYAPTTKLSYSSSQKGASCALVLTEAGPLDARGDSVVVGGRIAATFTCTAIVSSSKDAMPTSFVVEDGMLAATVE